MNRYLSSLIAVIFAGLFAQSVSAQQIFNNPSGQSFRTATEFGHNGVSSGQAQFSGATSGTTIVQVPAVAGSFNYNLPLTAGTSGQVQTSGGGGSTPMGWLTLGTAASQNTGTSGTTIPFLDGVNTWSGAQTFAGITFTSGSISGAPVATLEHATWTPVLTFATPGDLSVTYAAQIGHCTKLSSTASKQATCTFNVVTSAFTFTTAAGALLITGLPYTSENTTGQQFAGSMLVGGITKATYTQFLPKIINNVSQFEIVANGSGVGSANVTAVDTPTGGTMNLRGTVVFEVQ